MQVRLKLRMCPYLEIDINRVFTDISSQNDINSIRVGPKSNMTGSFQRKREVPQKQEGSHVKGRGCCEIKEPEGFLATIQSEKEVRKNSCLEPLERA